MDPTETQIGDIVNRLETHPNSAAEVIEAVIAEIKTLSDRLRQSHLQNFLDRLSTARIRVAGEVHA